VASPKGVRATVRHCCGIVGGYQLSGAGPACRHGIWFLKVECRGAAELCGAAGHRRGAQGGLMNAAMFGTWWPDHALSEFVRV